MDINLKLRGEVLEYSLNIEESVNSLLLFCLGLYDDNNLTRLFGNKVGITFKNKIDLLYDINVFSKEENFDFELMMFFRNKFLHDINCNSFIYVLNQSENSIKNKFKKFLDDGQDIRNEEDCKTAFRNMYLKNIKTIKDKLKDRRLRFEEKGEIINLYRRQANYQIDLFFNFIRDLFLLIENSELEVDEVRRLAELISGKCQQYVDKYKNDEELIALSSKLKLFFSDIEKVKDFWGIVKIDNKKILDIPNDALSQV